MQFMCIFVYYLFIYVLLMKFTHSLYLQNLKDQILTTNVWLEHVSIEYKRIFITKEPIAK